MAAGVAVVTGGASGMGRIIAKRLARDGYRVAILDLNEEGMRQTAESETGISAFHCDISREDDVERVVAEVVQQLGPVDRLVHAAALMPSRALVNHSPAEVIRLTEINYFGTLYLVKAVLPAMLERDAGDIIVFGSIAGQALVPKMGAYCATKAAVNVYMETLINELAHTRLNIHLVCPPAVNTPLIDQTLQTDTPGSIAEAKKTGRLADPEKIVDAIDKAMAKGKKIIYPGEARLLYLWHALFPGLWWKVVMKFEK
jgi:NAD(P)-dependent dehydrogenase (short-subunit alcohol dehydrogenase family)